jgi:hypothetical protein
MLRRQLGYAEIITDDLDALLDALPPYISEPVRHGEDRSELLEVVLDLGSDGVIEESEEIFKYLAQCKIKLEPGPKTVPEPGWVSIPGYLIGNKSDQDEDGVRRPEGRILTYRESVHHHVLGSMANLGTVQNNAKQLLDYFYNTRKRAVDPNGPYARRTFAVLPSANVSRFRRESAPREICCDPCQGLQRCLEASDSSYPHRWPLSWLESYPNQEEQFFHDL